MLASLILAIVIEGVGVAMEMVTKVAVVVMEPLDV